ncbi:MAG TPA: ABC transporter ATP-binding protein, partial [Segetibacter sp.]
HDVQEAFELGDRICLMDKGKIVQMGKATDLLFNPLNDFVSSFINEHHFQLELQNILIKDVWPFLPPATDGTDEKVFSVDDSLWQILETVSVAQWDFKSFVSKNNNDKKQVDIVSLMAAFTKFKSSSKNG